jgi:hypothetical protein
MIEWKQRLRAEYYELRERWLKLKQFLEAPIAMSERSLLLLTRQEKAMQDYHDILLERLSEAGWGLSLRLPWMKGTHHCDWTEDFEHENGNYHCKCCYCAADFIGYKRRIVCRECHTCERIKNAD